MSELKFSSGLNLWKHWTRYVAKYTKRAEMIKNNIDPDNQLEKELKQMEMDLPTSVIMFFRSIAEKNIKKKYQGMC